MKRTRVATMASGFSILFLPFLMACLWDYDTVEMERSRFPSTLELITGKFVRHSEAYYKWRAQDRLQRLTAEPENLVLLDDLAVAYDKLGKHQMAIDAIQRSLELQPERYESLANLGTFHIHAGNLETGLDFIKQAITINPDAHFGREVYQQRLVEYVLQRRQTRSESGGPGLPLRDDSGDFANFLFKDQNTLGKDNSKEIEAAITGVLGMMRFGDWTSPILLEALGDLLLAGQDKNDAKQLAARAYLRAAAGTSDREAATAYLTMARGVLTMQVMDDGQEHDNNNEKIRALKSQLESEIAEANRWFQTVVRDEKKWIDAGGDVDQAFSAKYYADPVVGVPTEQNAEGLGFFATVMIGLTAFFVIVAMAYYMLAR